ncbi:MAG: hypothetical protein LJE95_09525, partial [Acidobacteria bacterium]|nr:hypothetical protein [Acidobacteriota bacterium]
MSARPRAAIATTLELLFGVGVVASLAVLFAGQIVVAGLRIRSAAPAVLVVLLCGTLRMVIARRTPFLFSRRTPQDLDRVASSVFSSLTATGEEASRWAGWRLVVLLAAVSFLLKVANAWYYRGFFSGDDVEILEWVLSRLQGWQYSPWALRNPFFPFSFLFPPLWAAHSFGLHDTWSLVFLARLCVALCSSVAVIFAYLIGKKLSGSRAGGTFVAASVAIGGLFIRFSS